MKTVRDTRRGAGCTKEDVITVVIRRGGSCVARKVTVAETSVFSYRLKKDQANGVPGKRGAWLRRMGRGLRGERAEPYLWGKV